VSTIAPSEDDCQRWPLLLFARLETALEIGDLEQATEAQHRLAQLGIQVSFDCLRPTKEEEANV
jgi:hypothetical protein